jgi:hypothetical protein
MTVGEGEKGIIAVFNGGGNALGVLGEAVVIVEESW